MRRLRVIGEETVRKRSSVDARYTAAVISTGILGVLAELADKEHVAVEPWLTGQGLTRGQIDDAAVRVSYRQASLIIKRALQAIAIGVENAAISHALVDLELETSSTGEVSTIVRQRFADREILAFLCEEF